MTLQKVGDAPEVEAPSADLEERRRCAIRWRLRALDGEVSPDIRDQALGSAQRLHRRVDVRCGPPGLGAVGWDRDALGMPPAAVLVQSRGLEVATEGAEIVVAQGGCEGRCHAGLLS